MIPASRIARRRPRLLITVTTSVSSVSRPRSAEVERAHRHDLVAVDDPARRVDREDPVGVAVEGEPDIGARGEHRFTHGFRMLRTTSIVDVAAVRRDVDRDDVGARVRRTREVRPHGQRRCAASIATVDAVETTTVHRRDQPIDVARREACRRSSRFLTTTQDDPARPSPARSSTCTPSASLRPPVANSLMPLSA